MIRTSVLV